MDRLVTVKGNRYGMEIYMDSEVSFDILMKSMEEKFRNSAKFFQGAQIWPVRFLVRRLTYLGRTGGTGSMIRTQPELMWFVS